ncbi:MAG: DUF6340 family protein [Dysgonamonadaceae bacterium]|jgi:hypothetical protein|nr:DUF6340 family protein [Dysgonamonadaceae bacterium]
MKNGLFFICIFLLASCSSLYRFTIEVQQPAPITLPPDVVDIAIVNNSAPQPGDKGVTRIYKGAAISDYPLNLDSAANITTASLAAHLQESSFFNRVLVSPASIRTDENWMGSEPLPDAFKNETFAVHGFDGIVSIDRLLFKLDQEVSNNYYLNIHLNSIATCTIYVRDRETPLTSFSISDSLAFSTAIWGDTVDIVKYFPESVIGDLAYSIGKQLSERIIPSWIEKERFLYSGSQARMTEALSFARKSRWKQAEALWTNEYARASQPDGKGKLAANLAVASEMQDQFAAALQWATVAQIHFREAGLPDTSKENIRIEFYVNDLQKRIRDDSLLDLQWGIPSD